MWMIINETPFAAERTFVRDKHGAHLWVVAVRASFEWTTDGTLRPADDQPAPKELPEYLADPAHSTLLFDADLGHPKPGTDLILISAAHAPRQRPLGQLVCGFRLGQVQKAILVFGQRQYVSGPFGPRLSKPAPFVTQTICYEVAFGGTDASAGPGQSPLCDPRNPIGRGVAKQSHSLLGTSAHCLEYPGVDPGSGPPAGFNAIPGHWLPRRAYAGTYDANWESRKQPLLPDDFDLRFAMSAPADQQFYPHLRGGERLELANLTPEGVMRLVLPSLQLRYQTWIGTKRLESQGKLVSVVIETESRRMTLVHQTSLEVSAQECDYLDQTLITMA